MATNKKSYPIVTTDKDPFFTFVEAKAKEVHICVGNQLVSQKVFKTIKDAQDYLQTKPWEVIVNVQCVVTEKIMNHEKSKETN